MNIKLIKRIVFISSLLLGSVNSGFAQTESGKAEVKVEGSKSAQVDWQSDPNCQFIFFAVLEGLYRDGVQDEIVDALIGKAEEGVPGGVKRAFVFRCKLCHATYEAFRTYRARPVFEDSKRLSSFGKGISAKIIEEFKDKDVCVRIDALGRLIKPWISKRVEMARMTKDEKKAMSEAILKFTREAKDLKKELVGKDPAYIDWTFYGGCRACEVAEEIGE